MAGYAGEGLDRPAAGHPPLQTGRVEERLGLLGVERAPHAVEPLEGQLAGLLFGSVRRPRGVEPVDVEARVGIGHDGEASPPTRTRNCRTT